MTTLELIASALGVLSVWLTVRQNPLCWPIGLVMVSLYGWFFFEVRLYSQVLLNGVFAAMQVYGWWQWTRGSGSEGGRPVVGATALETGAGLTDEPTRILPEPVTTLPPCVVGLPRKATGLPLTKIVASPSDIAPPQLLASPTRAAGRLLNNTSGEPTAIGLEPWPGMGQEWVSDKRAAGLAIRVPFVSE